MSFSPTNEQEVKEYLIISAQAALIREWHRWQNIAAVRDNKIFTIDGDILHRSTPRALEGLDLLCQAIDNARDH